MNHLPDAPGAPGACDPARTIQACVDARLLRKADRLFTGTTEGRMIELLQNARRAGARNVTITVNDGWVTVQDDGRGIDDFQNLLALGRSGWSAGTEESEDPAGVGLFCLAPRETMIVSRGHRIRLTPESWTGSPVPVEASDEPATGTLIRFHAGPIEASHWASLDYLRPYAVFTGLTVTTPAGTISPTPFLPGGPAYLHPELGVNIELRPQADWPDLHRIVHRRVSGSYAPNVMLNFHGQVIAFSLHDVKVGKDVGLGYLVDMTGAPTDLRLMLPARTRIVENEAFKQLQRALVLNTFRYLKAKGMHTLPYSEWQRAKDEFGVELPESDPVYELGLLFADDMGLEPPAISLPEDCDWPAAKCYRAKSDAEEGVTNAHLFHVYGDPSRWPCPFVPIDVSDAYAGYRWYADIPMIESVELIRSAGELHRDYVAGGEVVCVQKMSVRVTTSDGKIFESPVPVARDPDQLVEGNYVVLVTPDARDVVFSDTVWYLLGGPSDEGDTFDTQQADFEKQYGEFWLAVAGPDETARVDIIDAVEKHFPEWEAARLWRDGSVRVTLKDGTQKEIRPAKPVSGAAGSE